MTARYLLTVTDADAAILEGWLGTTLKLSPMGFSQGTVAVTGLDAITGGEYETISRRLRTSGPPCHAGRPGQPPPGTWSPCVVLADLSLPHQIHLMHAQSPSAGGYQLAVSCNCTIHGPRSRYEPIETRSRFSAAEAIAAWRAWHAGKGVAV